jgi:hypothetical protein
MTETIENNNQIIPERTSEKISEKTPEKIIKMLTVPKTKYKFGTLSQEKKDTASHQNPTINTDDSADTQESNISYLHFFSSSEARLCLQIIKEIEKNIQTLLIALPAYAQDTALAKRIGDYIRLPNTKSVVIDAKGLNAKQIIAEYSRQLSLKATDNMYHEFAHLMTDYFKHGLVLHSVIYNAQSLTKQDFDYLYELASLIYEKFPNQRHKPLMRFVFIGDKSIAPILRKKTNGHFKQFTLPALTLTECVNALYLYTPPEARTELFFQTVGTNASGIRIATAGYAALLRLLLPMPVAPSLADRKNPEYYLSTMINNQIDSVFHKELAHKRLFLKQGYHFVRPRTYIRLFLGATAVALGLLGYYIIA